MGKKETYYLVFTIDRIPDLTLAKYSVLDGSSVSDIMEKHGVFLRQLHRLGSISQVYFHLLYYFDPDPRISKGHHLSVIFYATSADRRKLDGIRAFLTTSVLSTYYDFHCYEVTDRFEPDILVGSPEGNPGSGQQILRMTNIAGEPKIYGIGKNDAELIREYQGYQKQGQIPAVTCELASDGDAVLSINQLRADSYGRVQFAKKHVLARRLKLENGKLRVFEGEREDSLSAVYEAILPEEWWKVLEHGVSSAENARFVCCFAPDSDTVTEIWRDVPCDSRGNLTVAWPWMERRFPCAAFLTKKDYDLPALNLLQGENSASLYAIMEWEPSEEGRLYNVLKLMEGYQRTAALRVDIFPVEMTQRIREVLPYQQTRARIAQRSQGKDDNSENIIRAWDKYLQNLVKFPQFFANVTAFADTPDIAVMLADSVAAEAVESGTYLIRNITAASEQEPALRSGYSVYHGDQQPMNQQYRIHPERIPQTDYISQFLTLYTLEELRPMFSFPILYPGEAIECLKETDPRPDDGRDGETVPIGVSALGYQVDFPVKLFKKHAFIAGVPGSGKTNTMLHLVTSLWRDGETRVPFLVLEPAKQEYRALANIEGMEELRIFSPGADTSFPLHINPFQFPVGLTLAEHIANLNAVFAGAFELPPPSPHFIDTCIEQVYVNLGWNVNERNTLNADGSYRHPFPTLQELYDSLETAVKNSHYQGETLGNLQSVLEVRVGSLLKREIGNVYNVRESILRPEEWLDVPAIIELESLGEGPANFMSLLLSTLIRETLKVRKVGDGLLLHDNRNRNQNLNHVIFYEEAHNLVGPNTDSPTGDSVDPKISATKYLVKMLAEVRALNEGIVIADQLPTAMASEVLKNTGLKIAHRITAQDDRSLLGGTMSASGDQLEEQGIFGTGWALIFYEGLQKPYKMRVAKWDEDDSKYQSKSNRELSAYLVKKRNRVYLDIMIKSANIMGEKIVGEFGQLEKRAAKLKTNLKRETLALRAQQELLKNSDVAGDSVETAKKKRRYETQKAEFLSRYDQEIRMLCRAYGNQYYASVTLAVNYELNTDDPDAAEAAVNLYTAAVGGLFTLFENMGALTDYVELAEALVSESRLVMEDIRRFVSLETPGEGMLFGTEMTDRLLYASCYYYVNQIFLETVSRTAKAGRIAAEELDREKNLRAFGAEWTARFEELLLIADTYAAAADALAASAAADARASYLENPNAYDEQTLQVENLRHRRFALYKALHSFVLKPISGEFRLLRGYDREVLLEATDTLRRKDYRQLVQYKNGTEPTRLSSCSEYESYRRQAAVIAQIELNDLREKMEREMNASIERIWQADQIAEKAQIIRDLRNDYSAFVLMCSGDDVAREDYSVILLETYLKYLDKMMDLGQMAVREIDTDQCAHAALSICSGLIRKMRSAPGVTEQRVESWLRVTNRWNSLTKQ